MRSDLSRLEEIRAGRLQQEQSRDSLFFKYNVPQKYVGEVIEGLKQQVQAFHGRLYHYHKQKLKKSQN